MSAITIATRSSRSKRSTAVAIACSRIVVTRPPPRPRSDRRRDARTPRAARRGRARRRSPRPSRTRASLPAMSPIATVLERLSTTISVRLASFAEPAWRIASQFEPSFSSASPVRTNTRCSSSAARAQRVRDADRHRQPVAERARRDLDAGHVVAVRVAAEDPVPRQEALQLLGGEEAVLEQHGVERERPVALREEEAVAPLPLRVASGRSASRRRARRSPRASRTSSRRASRRRVARAIRSSSIAFHTLLY